MESIFFEISDQDTLNPMKIISTNELSSLLFTNKTFKNHFFFISRSKFLLFKFFELVSKFFRWYPILSSGTQKFISVTYKSTQVIILPKKKINWDKSKTVKLNQDIINKVQEIQGFSTFARESVIQRLENKDFKKGFFELYEFFKWIAKNRNDLLKDQKMYVEKLKEINGDLIDKLVKGE